MHNKECALAHSSACGGRLRHLPYTPQCASSRSVLYFTGKQFPVKYKRYLITMPHLQHIYQISFFGYDTFNVNFWISFSELTFSIIAPREANFSSKCSYPRSI